MTLARCAAPLPSPDEQAVIDRFGIYGERATPPYAYWRCAKRVTYATDKEARTALNQVVRKRAVQGQLDRLELRHHWCSQHGGFHLTSKPWSGR